MHYLLKNGIIFDSSQKKLVKKDVLIKGEIIESVDDTIEIKNSYTLIDCTNKIISPGFIDCHSHNDFFNFKDKEYFESFINQGITTQISGNCGFSYYGTNDTEYQSSIGGNLFSVDHTLDFKSYKEKIDGNLNLNMAFLIGHGTIRSCIKGFNETNLTNEEKEQMKILVKNNLDSGCIGGSLGLMYEPGIYANKEELELFASEIQKQNKIITIHPKANSDISLAYSIFKRKHIKLGLMECINLMEKTKVNLEYSHLIFVGAKSWKSLNSILKIFKKYNNLGYNLNFDIYPFDFGVSVITVLCPPWYLKLSPENKNKKFTQFKLKTMIKITRILLGIEYKDLKVTYINNDQNYQKLEGKNLEEISTILKLSPLDAYIHLIDISEGKAKILLSKYSNDHILKSLMNSEYSLFMTDAWYEDNGVQNDAIYYAFPYFIKKTDTYNLPLEDTLYKMTKKICEKYNLPNRGEIKEGYFADITIFDYNEIINQNNLKLLPNSIKQVFINGSLVKDNNQLKFTKKGKIIEN